MGGEGSAAGEEPLSVREEKGFDLAPVEGFEAGDGIPLDYAWPELKIAVCSDLSDEERGELEAEGWRILPDDPDVVNDALREAA